MGKLSNRKSRDAEDSWIGWIVGAVLVIAPFLILEWAAGKQLEAWSAVYVAGAIGGLVLEFMRNAWRLERPSSSKPGKAAEASFAPFGPLTDTGFLGRMFTGGVVAPVFLILVNALDASSEQARNLGGHLAGVAVRPDTIAWGVAVGFASPAVWALVEGFVKSRAAVANLRLEKEVKKTEAEHVKAGAAVAMAKLKDGKQKEAQRILALTLADIAEPTASRDGNDGQREPDATTETKDGRPEIIAPRDQGSPNENAAVENQRERQGAAGGGAVP